MGVNVCLGGAEDVPGDGCDDDGALRAACDDPGPSEDVEKLLAGWGRYVGEA